jgi:DnaJ-class molecular chaperone
MTQYDLPGGIDKYELCESCKGEGRVRKGGDDRKNRGWGRRREGVSKQGSICRACHGRGVVVKGEYRCQHVCGCDRYADLFTLFCAECVENVASNVQCK